jgi:hypothetical protein
MTAAGATVQYHSNLLDYSAADDEPSTSTATQWTEPHAGRSPNVSLPTPHFRWFAASPVLLTAAYVCGAVGVAREGSREGILVSVPGYGSGVERRLERLLLSRATESAWEDLVDDAARPLELLLVQQPYEHVILSDWLDYEHPWVARGSVEFLAERVTWLPAELEY